MKRTLYCSLVSFLMCSGAFGQQKGNLGAGFMFGEPTGIAWNYRMSQTNAIDGAIGFLPYERYRLNLDYLWEVHPFRERSLGIHYGPGLAFGFGATRYVAVGGDYFYRESDLGFGVRGVVGLDYLIPRSPVDVFVEVAPVIEMAPASASTVDAGFGVRFYF